MLANQNSPVEDDEVKSNGSWRHYEETGGAVAESAPDNRVDY